MLPENAIEKVLSPSVDIDCTESHEESPYAPLLHDPPEETKEEAKAARKSVIPETRVVQETEPAINRRITRKTEKREFFLEAGCKDGKSPIVD